MSWLREIQREQADWAAHNFPQNQGPEFWYVPLLGVGEEAGELFHAALKYSQGIRGIGTGELEEAEVDAIGDIMIYLMDFCNRRGYDMEDAILGTWDKVRMRDWQKRPKTG